MARLAGPAPHVPARLPEPNLDADQPVLAVRGVGTRRRRDRRRPAAGAAPGPGGSASPQVGGVACFLVNPRNPSKAGEASKPSRPRNRKARAGLAAAAAGAVLAAAMLAGCGSSGPAGAQSPQDAANAAAMANPNLDMGTSLDNSPAPDIKLTNQFGQPMSLSQFRGRVVIVAFSDSECTTVCPLITQSMLLAKRLLGKARSEEH